MRGKLRDKYDAKRDRLKRDLLSRRPNRRDNRNLDLQQQVDETDDSLLAEEEALLVEKEQQN
jgi:hypothetical protein